MFPAQVTPEKYKTATITGYFVFVLEENSVRRSQIIVIVIIVIICDSGVFVKR